jgi:hypothetical protein
VAAVRSLDVSADDPRFCQVVFDVLGNSLIHDDASRERRSALTRLLSEYVGEINHAYS